MISFHSGQTMFILLHVGKYLLFLLDNTIIENKNTCVVIK